MAKSTPRDEYEQLAGQLGQVIGNFWQWHSGDFCPVDSWSPAVNLYRYESYYDVCVDLAGVDRKLVDVRVQPGMLVIRGTREAPEPRVKTGGIMRISASGVTGTMWRLRWESDAADEVCSSEIDLDGDTLVGCADPDCDNRCASCGDGSCSLVEDCHLCPMDCGVCAERCGDATCDPSESAASCPGDC